MKAIVMAGGMGSRLRPLTIDRPKPMIPVVNKPVMGHLLDLLKQNEIFEAVITLHYRADMIQAYFHSGGTVGMELVYSVEDVPLGTAGSVRHAAAYLSDSFVVASGDTLTDFDLQPIIAYHRDQQALATIVLTKVAHPLEYGVVITDGNGRVTGFQEKPDWSEVISDTVNTGIYIFEPEVLKWIPDEQPSDWSKDILPRLLEDGQAVLGYVAEGYWCDIGHIPAYLQACADVLYGRVKLPAIGRQLGEQIWVGANVEIAADAQLWGPIYLGHEVKIKSGVVINGPASIGANTVIDGGARIDHSHIWRNCYIGEGVELQGALVGQQCTLKKRSVLFEGVIVGDHTIIGEKAELSPGIKIWPGKEVEAGAMVKSSLIWGATGRRTLFGPAGVTGVVNVELTPEMVAKLGASFAATLPKHSWVTINQDPQRSPVMLKRAMVAGLSSAGINVWDLNVMPIPVARYYTRLSNAVAGVDVRLSPYDPRMVDIRFMNGEGRNMDRNNERTVEWIYFREDFRRADMDDIGTIEPVTDGVERYCQEFLEAVDVELIRQAGFHIVVDYSHSPNVTVLPQILAALQVEVVPLNADMNISKMAGQQSKQESWLQQLARIVGVLKTDFGVQLDVAGEKITIVTDNGALAPDDIAALMMANLALRANARLGTVAQPKIAVPIDQTMCFEALAYAYQAEIIRTKVEQTALTQAATEPQVILAVDGRGGFIFPAFQPAFDGLMTLVKLLEFMALLKTRISQVVADLPSFYIAGAYQSCPWEKKGQVMRLLNAQFKHARSQTTDGIKIFLSDESWVLVQPDPYYPHFRIQAEAPAPAQAEILVKEYQELVEAVQR